MAEQMKARQNNQKNASKNLATQLVLLMGLVSALGDITYERVAAPAVLTWLF